MSQTLYDAAPVPKDLFLIPDGSHFQIYKPGALSYLKAMERFLERIDGGQAHHEANDEIGQPTTPEDGDLKAE